MKGPFKPEDFDKLEYPFDPHKRRAMLADHANSLDAKRWACPKGGEHEPMKVDPRDAAYRGHRCTKCGAQLRARWEMQWLNSLESLAEAIQAVEIAASGDVGIDLYEPLCDLTNAALAGIKPLPSQVTKAFDALKAYESREEK